MSAEPLHTDLHLSSLSIKGFRGIADLAIPQLGRVTLIAGKNDTGKTSILEGVRLLAEGATLGIIREILQSREENAAGVSNDEESSGSRNFLVSALFHGFPRLSETSESIVISSNDNSHQMQMRINWFLERIDEDGNLRLHPDEVDPSEELDSIPALVVTTENRKRIHPIDRIDRFISRRMSSSYDSTGMSSLFVSSFGTDRTEMLGLLWDSISLTEREPYVIEALQIIDPKISAVSMVAEGSRQSRVAVVRSDNFTHRVRLRSFGDGMNRLFGIILSLVNIRGGILLIDEFENGMHHTVQVDVWRMIFRLAHELNVQVLATTHSWDCIAGFAKAAAEEKGVDGLLVRIDRLGDRVRPVEYGEEDLQVVTQQQIEVR